MSDAYEYIIIIVMQTNICLRSKELSPGLKEVIIKFKTNDGWKIYVI